MSNLQKKLFIVLPSEQIWKGRFGGHVWRSEAKQKVSAIFLDSGTRQKPGGTGITFDWAKAVPVLSVLEKDFRFVVAGGLTPENVSKAIKILDPWGVDVSSGVEASPGKKDPLKVRAFIQAVRESEKN